MSYSNWPSWVANGITFLAAALSTNEVAQLILYILGIIGAVASLAFNIYAWVKDAKADGKVTKEEAKDLADTVANGVKDIADKVADTPEKGDNKEVKKK